MSSLFLSVVKFVPFHPAHLVSVVVVVHRGHMSIRLLYFSCDTWIYALLPNENVINVTFETF